jgi:NADH-quinone oxidoreductase subunit C
MPKKDLIAEKLEHIVSKDAICRDDEYRTGVALSLQLPLAALREAMAAAKDVGFFVEAITGADFTDTLQVVYHLNCYEPRSRIALRVLFPHGEAPETVGDLFPSAIWQEREVHDFFGIAFKNHGDLRPLILPEDADYHPHLKSFGKVHAYRKWEEVYG